MALSFSKLSSLISGKSDTGRNAIVGIDVGSTAIKVVQIHDQNGVATLDTYGELQLGPYGETDIGRMTNLPIAKLVQALVDIIREASVTTKSVVLSISYNSSFVTVVQIGAQNQNDIASRIPVEARKFIPVPLTEVTLDWFPLGTEPDGTTKVLLAALHNDALKKYETLTSSATLNKRATEIELFSVIRSSVAQNDKTVAILDIGASAGRVYIVNEGLIKQTHGVRLGGTEMTNMVHADLKTTFSDAELEKREDGLGNPEFRELAMFVDRGLHEVGKVLKRYEEDAGVTVNKIILSGSGSLMPGFLARAKDVLQKQVISADPFAKVAYPAFLEDTLVAAGPTFSVALGAALRVMVSNE